jgi:hypothetical protein
MKRLAMCATLLASALVIPQANAQHRCSNEDAVGNYSFVVSGSFGAAGFAAAGQTTYDGNGGATGVIQISLGGNVTPVIAWTATYTVNPDCTATKTMTIPGLGPNGAALTVHFFMTAGDHFNELRFIATDPTTVISGSARKQQ